MPRSVPASAPLVACVAAVLALYCPGQSFASASGVEGVWRQLGVPIRLGSPLLWDDLEKRLVVIGADALGAGDSIEDAWEFREATGWKRIRLPQPPVKVSPLQDALVADQVGRRFLTLVRDPYPLTSVRLWALELGPPARWVPMDMAAGPPTGSAMLDPSGQSVWIRTAYFTGVDQLWARSLADTGQWRLARAVPQAPGYPAMTWVEPGRGRCYTLGRRASPPYAIEIWSLPLVGEEGWTVEADSTPRSVGSDILGTVPDSSRNRRVFVTQSSSQTGDPVFELWGFAYEGPERWSPLVSMTGLLTGRSIGLAGDTLWAHTLSDSFYGASVRTIAIALANPSQPRTIANPAWPPFTYNQPFFHDPKGARWLHASAPGFIPAFSGGFADSLWELKLDGDAVTWRRLQIEGQPPMPSLVSAWTVDEESRTLYLMKNWDDGVRRDSTPELWALRFNGRPRWTLMRSGGTWPVLGGWPVLVFDSIQRQLVCFGSLPYSQSAPDANMAWTLAVDSLTEWRQHIPEGTPPAHPSATSGVFDPARERVVFTRSSEYPVLGSLELTPPMRWVWHGVNTCPFFKGDDCIPSLTGSRGFFDPIQRRYLLLGGSALEFGVFPDLYAIDSGDSLGPGHRLSVQGSGGRQAYALGGYDAERDALIVFGNWNNFSPSLHEFRFGRGEALVARPGSFSVHDDLIALRWSGTPGAAFRLWRREGGTDWTPLATLAASAAGEIEFDDRAIEAGRRYGYRLTSAVEPFAPAAADTWLTAATAASFSLARPWPNPARGSLNLAFTLAASAPAELDVFDIAGRRVWGRRLIGLASGPHHVAIAPSELPRSGLYFVRLRQAGLTATARVVLAR